MGGYLDTVDTPTFVGMNVTGDITATRYLGDGSQLTGVTTDGITNSKGTINDKDDFTN